MGLEERKIALEDVKSGIEHLLGGEPRIEPQIGERFIEPADVLFKQERLVSGGAGRVEGAVPHRKTVVAEGNAHLALRQEIAVEICDTLIGH